MSWTSKESNGLRARPEKNKSSSNRYKILNTNEVYVESRGVSFIIDWSITLCDVTLRIRWCDKIYKSEIHCLIADGIVMFVIIWQLDLQLPVKSVLITTKVVSSNPVNGEVYLIQLYGIKFVSDLRQVGGFHRVLWSPQPK